VYDSKMSHNILSINIHKNNCTVYTIQLYTFFFSCFEPTKQRELLSHWQLYTYPNAFVPNSDQLRTQFFFFFMFGFSLYLNTIIYCIKPRKWRERIPIGYSDWRATVTEICCLCFVFNNNSFVTGLQLYLSNR